MRLFASEDALHAYLYNQAVTSDSRRVQRLLAENKVEEAYRAWREECGDEPSFRFECNVHELEIPLHDSASSGGRNAG